MSKFTQAVRNILVTLRNKIEDITDAVVSTHRLRELKAGKRKTISLEEMMKRHGIEPDNEKKELKDE